MTPDLCIPIKVSIGSSEMGIWFVGMGLSEMWSKGDGGSPEMKMEFAGDGVEQRC